MQDIKKGKELERAVNEYFWDYYCDLQGQRAQNEETITKALLAAVADDAFAFSGWWRIMDYQFSNDPLSPKGSVLSDAGGRFNISGFKPQTFQAFPALYLASTEQTAYTEKFCPRDAASPFTPDELALRPKASYSAVCIHGRLETVIDLRQPHRLQGFLDIVGKFGVSQSLIPRARALKLDPPDLIDSIEKLENALLEAVWRQWPMRHDVPSTTQIFGQLVRHAGIEGIIYPSTVHDAGICLAVFPSRLGKNSFVELSGPHPPNILRSRMDETNGDEFEL